MIGKSCVSAGFVRIGTPAIHVFTEFLLGWYRWWLSGDDFLFIGLESEVKNNRMPNKMKGRTDYLTVSGSPGSYVFRCPDTDEYKDADEDLLWADSGGTLKDVTTASLVGKNYYRTVVKFGNESPNALIGIGILKAGVTLTQAKIDRMHSNFWLWIYWSDVLNGHGVLKSNMLVASMPTPISAVITDAARTQVKITFDQDLDDTSLSDISAFGIPGKTITNDAISGPDLYLTVSVAFDYGDIVTVSYTKPIANPLIGLIAGRRTDSFTDFAVTNNITYINLLADGNTFGFYDSLNAAAFTFSSGVNISKWADSLGSGNDFLQATGSKQPTLTADGVTFARAAAQHLRVTATLNQPVFVYIAFRYKHWGPTAAGEFIFSGSAANVTLKQEFGDSEPMLRISAGANSPPNSDLLKNTYGIARCLFNGATLSSFQINTGVKWVGNVFTSNPGGMVLNGRHTDGNAGTDSDVLGVVIRKVADSDTTSGTINNFLLSRYADWLT
jgi:hypothetical protein